MSYALGIDLGSGRTTAAISRNDRERWLEPEVVALDGDPAGAVSVMHVTDEGAVEIGGCALRTLPARADWVARDVAARVGDEIPIMLGGAPYPAEVLTAAAVGWVVDYVEALEGTPATQLMVTHPAAWGMRRRALLLTALREVNLPDPTLLPRPVAVAEAHAWTQRVEVGEQLAVLSVGAGRPESAVLRRGPFGFELRSHGEGVEEVCGDLFDDLLAEHVISMLTSAPRDGSQELAELRAACTSAKERLSAETSVSVSGVEVTRADFEELIRSAVESAVESLSRAIQAGGEVTTVVVAGGSARIPLVRELVGARTRARVVVAAPETSVARGAAAAAAKVAKPTVRATAMAMVPEPIPRPEITHTDLMRLDDLPEQDLTELGPPPPRPPVEIAPLELPRRRLLSRRGKPTNRDSEPTTDSREVPDSPDLGDPEGADPDRAHPGKAHHDQTHAGRAHPHRTQRDHTQPDQTDPAQTHHDRANPDSAHHDRALPDQTHHDQTHHDKAYPDRANPDQTHHDWASPDRQFADLALPPREERRHPAPHDHPSRQASPRPAVVAMSDEYHRGHPRRHPQPAPADHRTSSEALPGNRSDWTAPMPSGLERGRPVNGDGSMAAFADRASDLFSDTAVDHRLFFEPARHRASEPAEQPRHQLCPPPTGSPRRGADTAPEGLDLLAADQEDPGETSRHSHAATAGRRHRYRQDAFDSAESEGGRRR